MDSLCRLCRKERDQHTDKMHSFQKTVYPINLPPGQLIGKKKKSVPDEPFKLIQKLPPGVTKQTEDVLQQPGLPIEPERPEPTPADNPEVQIEHDGYRDGVIVARYPNKQSGIIRGDGDLKGNGLFFGEENVITTGPLEVGTRVRFKKEKQFGSGTEFRAVKIEIYRS